VGASSPKSSKAPRPTAWLNGEGARYKRPLPGRTNWLGRTVRGFLAITSNFSAF
jgi:hypothetical protein